MATPTEPILPSQGDLIVGKYRVDSVIGLGGMGVVVAATHVNLSDRVALKLLRSDAHDPDTIARFMREGQAAVRIKGENAARIFDVGMHEGTPFIVMELLEGTDLRSLLKQQGPLPQAEAVDYVLQACRAIAEAHAIGIVHRDVKPANLFLTQRADGSPLVKVLDFGISKAATTVDGKPNDELTQTATIIGSPHFISPEQARSARRADTRADVWSLGVVLYNLLTQSFPFDGETMTETLVAVLTETPAPIRSKRADLHPLLEAVILRCLAKNPSERIQTIDVLMHQLAPFASSADPASQRRLAVAMEAAEQQRAHQIAIDDQPTAATWGTTSGTRRPERSRVIPLVLALCGIMAIAGVVVGVLLTQTPNKPVSAAPPSPPPSVGSAAVPTTDTSASSASAIAASASASATPMVALGSSASSSSSSSGLAEQRRSAPVPPRPATGQRPQGGDLGGLLDTRR